MKLTDLVSAYKGVARFDVNSVAEDGNEDVVVFLSGEENAIKDSVINAELVRFHVSGVDGGIPTLNILVRKTADTDQGNTLTEPTE